MPNKFIFTISILLSMASNSIMAIDKVIYEDFDYETVNEEFDFHKNVEATAIMISEEKLRENIKVRDILFPVFLPSKKNAPEKICKDTPLINEYSFGTCSGVLVESDVLATAGHCVNDDIFERRWFFNVQSREQISAKRSYKVKSILKHKSSMVAFEYSKSRMEINLERKKLGLQNLGPDKMNFSPYYDIAFLKLDRPVKGVSPVRIDYYPKENDELVMVGHPLGVSQKMNFGGNSVEQVTPIYMTTNLDTFKGNSGSPVFSVKSGKLVGIMVNQGMDLSFGFDRKRRCYSYLHYSKEEKRKEHLSGMMTGDALRY